MVEVELSGEEIKALHELMNDAKAPIDMGYILGSFKIKVAKAWQDDMMQQQKQAAKAIVKNDKKLLKEIAKELEEDEHGTRRKEI